MDINLFEELLKYFGIDQNDYKELTKPITVDNFLDGHQLDNVSDAVNLIKNSINNNDKIVIYGDYDADGIMGTSIIVKSFKYLNYEVGYYIPNRYKDGYGINMDFAKKFIDKGYNLVILVDNGITSIEVIEYLRNNNVKVLVIDHHQTLDILPNANVIIHTSVSRLGDTPTSAGFLSFLVASALLQRFDKYLAILASISIVTDMMPLLSYNRNFLRYVFSIFNKDEFYCIDLLKGDDDFNEHTIGTKIGPKINAVGRLVENHLINRLVKYFVEDNKDDILYIKNWIEEINESRKQLSKEAIDSIKNIDSKSPMIFYLTEYKEGLLGLIANYLCINFKKIVIVISLDSKNEILKGSARGIPGFNVVEAFEYCKNLLEAYGGHELAGGFSIKKNNLDEFENLLKEFINKSSIDTHEKEEKSIQIKLNDINMDNYHLISTFSPFGESWKSPLFCIKRINTKNLFFSKNLENIMHPISQNTKLVGFNISKKMLENLNYIDILGNFSTNRYKSICNLQFIINKYFDSDFKNKDE